MLATVATTPNKPMIIVTVWWDEEPPESDPPSLLERKGMVARIGIRVWVARKLGRNLGRCLRMVHHSEIVTRAIPRGEC